MMPELLGYLSQFNDGIQAPPKYFELLNDILKFYSKTLATMPNEMNTFVISLVTRVGNEIENLEDGVRSNTLVISHCINVLRRIYELNFLIKNMDGSCILECNFEPLLKPLLSETKYDFEDDIVLLFNEVIKKRESVNQFTGLILKCTPNVFKKNKYVLGNLIQLFNTILINDKQWLMSDPSSISTIVQIGLHGINESP
jgi:hypothetical protein